MSVGSEILALYDYFLKSQCRSNIWFPTAMAEHDGCAGPSLDSPNAPVKQINVMVAEDVQLHVQWFLLDVGVYTCFKL